MFGIRSLLKTNPQIIKNVVQARNMSATCVPARNKISTAETLMLSALMVIGWSAIPAWVLVNIKNYRHEE